jgi:hypothetical protein
MTYEEIIELLDYAGGHEHLVRITTSGGQEVLGIPTSVDEAPDALEVFLRPLGADDTEIAIRLSEITGVYLT